jgi:hypothetical protein
MVERAEGTRVSYPFHAILAVAAAAALFLFNLVVGFIFMALVPPFIPIYICVLFAGACLLGNAVQYATRVSIRVPAAMLPLGKHEQEVADRAVASRAARARRDVAGSA